VSRLADALRHEAEGEVVRWSGRPSALRTFGLYIGAALVGIPWVAIVVFFFVADFLENWLPVFRTEPVTWKRIGAFCLYAGFMLALGAVGWVMARIPFATAWDASRRIHAVTDRRLITITGGRAPRVRTVWPWQIQEIERKERRDGSGDLWVILGYDKDGDWTDVEHLVRVPEVRRAEAMLMELRERASPAEVKTSFAPACVRDSTAP